MLKIVIVGCGQVGSRHLQSLAQLEESAQIFLVDPSQNAIEVAKERFTSVLQDEANQRFTLKECDLSVLDDYVDVAILATGSRERAELTRGLLNGTTPKYIIFEKFLFQEPADYDDIGELLASAQIKAWVNQWFSSTYAFKRIASLLNTNEPVSVEVSGDQWGLACNSVHFVELFDHLNNRGELEVVSSELDNRMIKSKREGYFEVSGKLTIKSQNNATLEMSSQKDPSDGLIHIRFKSGDRELLATLDAFNLDCEYIDKRASKLLNYTVPMQSNMTSYVVQSLMLHGACQLPEYDRSALQHKLLIDVFDPHFRQVCGWGQSGCPVT